MRNSSGADGAGGHEMRTSDPVRLTRTATERLLDGGDGHAGLRHLLDAAASPAAASEHAGEAAALAAFVDAPRTASLSSHPPRRTSVLSTALSKILAAKAIAVIAVAAAATGGVALAAQSTGARVDRPAADAHATTSARPSAPSESGPQDGSAGAAGQAAGEQSGPTTEASIAGLCHAWAAGETDYPGKAVQSPAFAALVAAAGDPDAVPAYCADLSETTAPGNSGSAPGRSDAAPGDSGSAPGHSGTAPGQSGTAPGHSGTAPGHSGTAPGHSSTAPGHSGTGPGQARDDSRPDHTGGGADGTAGDEAGRPADAHKPAEQKPDRSGGDPPNEEKTTQR
jgi:hypothetical protein